MKRRFRAWVFATIRIRNYADDLNRRAAVEQEMLDAAAGRSPMPDAAKLRDWAACLGVPDWMRECKP